MHDFDPGPTSDPFLSLVRDYPGPETYPPGEFRVEWGPVFHRGRLDGSARLLIIGQDPAQSETVVRRILVGEAGHRVQGLIAKLGIEHSYLMINTFLYSVYGQSGGQQHAADRRIVDYRHRWLDAIFASNSIDAVIALGQLAGNAWRTWKKTATGKAHTPAFQHVTHPTQPESSSGGDATRKAAATKIMLAGWNNALAALHPLPHRDTAGPLVPYGSSFKPTERVEIPERDVPAGLPSWMRSPNAWSSREGKTAAAKRRNITITVPAGIV